MTEKDSAVYTRPMPPRRPRKLWWPKNPAPYSGPLSPEEKAQCDRDLDEMRRQNFERIDRDIWQYAHPDIDQAIDRYLDQYIDQAIDRYLDQYMNDHVFSIMD